MSPPATAATIMKARDLLSLYRKILRGAQTYPSINRQRIYESIRVEFRENAALDPSCPKTQNKIRTAIKGLDQLHQFDVVNMTKGDVRSSEWVVSMEKNPMPKPPSS
mmetsp:Transcript_7621/g.9405  ORF Transcript_7621/g.9405 Transcript_7621/m.9405 type:complete len:107 (+) Transcript_7621:222-542(+)|eukprot:CAMPEP_0172498886 /NCGR_PEP_ID=MMETSP1066-20121228/119115_1 /TAXON_ID=671091 /ORGANISM="Coscinodiscus wailesii, Strain CCMP2513" /LENGTH=106 /DNA_ID=CAMNT_0013272349 /DNA_START=71 /DNA_END=391 /DNA_ORIENTATION=-